MWYQSPLPRAVSLSVTQPLTSSQLCPQADLVAILAASLPPGSAVEQKLVTDYFLPYLDMRGTLGNLHKARAREAVAGALSRGLQVVLEDGSRLQAGIHRAKLLAQLLEECGASPLCWRGCDFDRIHAMCLWKKCSGHVAVNIC
jgi:hypothetical protein